MKTTLRLLRIFSAFVLAGLATSAAAADSYSFTVTPSTTTYAASGGYVTVTVNLSYAKAIAALDLSIATPPGWKYVTATGRNVPQTPPEAGDLGQRGLAFVYTAMPGSPATFSVTISYPPGLSGPQSLSLIAANFTDEATSKITPVTQADIVLTPHH